MAEERASKSAADESKVGAQNDLEMTTKAVVTSKDPKETTQASCLHTAADHEATVATARKEELAALAQARKILADIFGCGCSDILLDAGANLQVGDACRLGMKGGRRSRWCSG